MPTKPKKRAPRKKVVEKVQEVDVNQCAGASCVRPLPESFIVKKAQRFCSLGCSNLV